MMKNKKLNDIENAEEIFKEFKNLVLKIKQKRSIYMDIGTKEMAIRCGVSMQTVSKWCREGKIPGATQDKKGSPWHIPKNAKDPRKK